RTIDYRVEREDLPRDAPSAGLSNVGIQRMTRLTPDANSSVVMERIGDNSTGEEDRPLVSAPTVADESARTTTRVPSWENISGRRTNHLHAWRTARTSNTLMCS